MISPLNISVGCDPELFVSRKRRVIGSEKVIPPTGGLVGVVRDGVQVELNPRYSNTVRGLADTLGAAINTLSNHLKVNHPDVDLDWRQLIEVEKAELDSLSPETRELGCQPSENAYGTKPITVDVTTYRKRSAAGHAHFGGLPSNLWYDGVTDDRAKLVPLCDIFIGNSCVMLDRDLGAAERRENYGRAGEYRLQPHGIEYRTPSNFWVRSYSLMSFVFGMGSFCVALAANTAAGGKVEQELINIVDIDNFIDAINTNSYDLAKRNFEVIVPFMRKHLPKAGFPLTPENLDRFLTLGDAVRKDGLERFFPDVPEVFWAKAERVEFNDFLATLF